MIRSRNSSGEASLKVVTRVPQSKKSWKISKRLFSNTDMRYGFSLSKESCKDRKIGIERGIRACFRYQNRKETQPWLESGRRDFHPQGPIETKEEFARHPR